MATIGECRFCKRHSAAHTHYECIIKYSTAIETAILKHFHAHPSKPLPSDIKKQLESEDWAFYTEWKESKEKLDQHRASLKRSIETKAKEVLKENENVFKEMLIPFEGKTFYHFIKCEVEIKVIPRY